MNFIAAITTYETRANFIKPTIESLLEQNLNKVFIMVGNELTNSMLNNILADLPVEIKLVEDIGPGKKHLAPLFCSPNDVIVTFDDDKIYHKDHAKYLIKEMHVSNGPTGAIGFAAKLPLRKLQPGPCDILHGETGICYKASWINTNMVLDWGRKPECFHNDDIYLGWLFKKFGHQCTIADVPHEIKSPLNNNISALAGGICQSPARRARLRKCMELTFNTQ